MATATLNVRLPEDLKNRGMRVLERNGISVSEFVRRMFQQLDQMQELPAGILPSEDERQAEIDRKRALLKSWVGVIPEDANLDDARMERLMDKCRPGVR